MVGWEEMDGDHPRGERDGRGTKIPRSTSGMRVRSHGRGDVPIGDGSPGHAF